MKVQGDNTTRVVKTLPFASLEISPSALITEEKKKTSKWVERVR